MKYRVHLANVGECVDVDATEVNVGEQGQLEVFLSGSGYIATFAAGHWRYIIQVEK